MKAIRPTCPLILVELLLKHLIVFVVGTARIDNFSHNFRFGANSGKPGDLCQDPEELRKLLCGPPDIHRRTLLVATQQFDPESKVFTYPCGSRSDVKLKMGCIGSLPPPRQALEGAAYFHQAVF
jgi:hypothetical protein